MQLGSSPALARKYVAEKKTSVHDRPESERVVGVFGLLVISFFWVSGGIYGNEELLSAAPPAYVLLALIIGPFVYSVPISLITGALSAARLRLVRSRVPRTDPGRAPSALSPARRCLQRNWQRASRTMEVLSPG